MCNLTSDCLINLPYSPILANCLNQSKVVEDIIFKIFPCPTNRLWKLASKIALIILRLAKDVIFLKKCCTGPPTLSAWFRSYKICHFHFVTKTTQIPKLICFQRQHKRWSYRRRMITWEGKAPGLLGGRLWQAAVQILQMERHNSLIELALWSCERDGAEVRGKIENSWIRGGHVGKGEPCSLVKIGESEYILIQVRQAALLNSLLVVFMGDLNWWESSSFFYF